MHPRHLPKPPGPLVFIRIASPRIPVTWERYLDHLRPPESSARPAGVFPPPVGNHSRAVAFRRPGHTTVIAYLALFVALSGTALAAKKIGPSQLQKNAVTTKKIANAAVTTTKIANDAVTSAKLDNGAVTEGKLANDAVTGDKLAAQSVGTNKLKDDAVESGKLANGAVVEAKIGNDAVNGSKVADGSLTLADTARAVIDVSPTPTGPSTTAPVSR